MGKGALLGGVGGGGSCRVSQYTSIKNIFRGFIGSSTPPDMEGGQGEGRAWWGQRSRGQGAG